MHYLLEYLKEEAVMNQLNLEIRELKKERKLALFMFVMLSLPAVILTFLLFTFFAGKYYLANTLAFFLLLVYGLAFVGLIMFIVQLYTINSGIKNIKFEK